MPQKHLIEKMVARLFPLAYSGTPGHAVSWTEGEDAPVTEREPFPTSPEISCIGDISMATGKLGKAVSTEAAS